MADGHFAEYSISLGQCTKEMNHMQKYADFISFARELKDEGPEGGVRITSGDKYLVPLIKKKFKVSNLKTYNPPDFKWIKNKDLLLSLIIGFIDGDGCISQVETQGEGIKSWLRIKVNCSWIDNLSYFYYFLHEYSGFKIKKKVSPPKVYRDKRNIFILSIYDNDVLAFMKRKIIELNLPVMARKWDPVDENHVSKIEKEKIMWPKIKCMLNEGVSKIEVSNIMGFSNKVLHRIIKEQTK